MGSYRQRRGSVDELLGVGVSPRKTAPLRPQSRAGSPRSTVYALRGVEERRPSRLAIRQAPTPRFSSVITRIRVPRTFAPGSNPCIRINGEARDWCLLLGPQQGRGSLITER